MCAQHLADPQSPTLLRIRYLPLCTAVDANEDILYSPHREPAS